MCCYDLILLSETWISNKHLVNLDIDGYESFHLFGHKSIKTKKGRQSGGISVYFRKELKNKISIAEKNDFGIIWLKIDHDLFLFDEDIYICHTYIPPICSKVLIDKDFDFFEEIENGIEKFSKVGKTYITGDLNSRTAQLLDILEFDKYLDVNDNDKIYDDDNNDDFFLHEEILPIRHNKDHVIDNNGRKLIALCKSTDHIIANGRLFNDKDGNYTFCSSRGLSVTDYLLVNKFNVDSITEFEILNWNNFSDHAALYFSFQTTCTSEAEKITDNTKHISVEPRIIFDEEKIPEFQTLLRQNIQRLEVCDDPSTSVTCKVEVLTKFLSDGAGQVFSKNKPGKNNNSKPSSTNKPKWFDDKCRTAKQEFIKARNTFTKNKSDENRITFSNLRTKYNRTRQNAKRRFKVNEGKRLESIAKSEPRKFWKSLKKGYNKPKPKNNDIKIENLFDHFNTLLGQDTDTLFNDTQFPQHLNDVELDSPITEHEIRLAVFKQKNGKASGPDELSAEIIKSSYDIISPYLVKIFNTLFDNSQYPDEWGVGFIVPIFKGGDPSSAKNYRGITLNNILAKIYSQVLLNRLTAWTEKYEKISNCQFGYQKGKSTTDCIFILNSIIMKVLNSGQKLYSIFIDYEKCFDKINRLFLWQKLLSENISSKMTNAIKAMYNSVRSVIKHNREKSASINSYLGVKQGDPTSSLLFMMFVNDIIANINTNLDGIFTVDELKLFLILYADDQVLFATSPTSLQSMLNDVEIYCNVWGLKINVEKTKVLIFEKGTRHTNYDFFLYGKRLELVTSFKYLGIYFFKNGNWHRSQKCIAEHGSKAMHRLFSILGQYEFKTHDKCKLFDILVASVLNYSAEVWGFNEGKDIELIHTKFLRKLLCVNKSTNLVGLYGELGRVPLSIMRKIHMFRYWIKILKSDDNCIIKQIYSMLKADADNNITYNKLNWAYQIKSMLEDLGLGNMWHEPQDNVFLPLIRQRILDQYYQSWYSNVNNSQRLVSYSRFKHSFELEPYLDSIHEKKFKISLSRFRLSSHSLEVERGRYFNIRRNERICQLCTTNSIENEYHFLLVCPIYKDLRRKYLKSYYCSWPNLNKFDNIMSSVKKNEILNLSKYIYFANKLRNDIIN